jgi:transketolase
LADKGFFPKEELKTFSKFNSRLIGHPNVKVPGIEANTGSLGHGLAIGAGLALGAKRDKAPQRVYVLMGDGEQAEGSVWEAAMFAANYNLDNLTAIIDRNRLQISGNTEDVMAIECLKEKYMAFGWDVSEFDGHNISEIITSLRSVKLNEGKPRLFIANTIKGKGVTFMENVSKWHHGVPTRTQMDDALSELDDALRELQ